MQNPRALWASCQNYFQQNIEASEYEKWFTQVVFESYSPATCTLILSIPSNYVAQYIEENYIQHLRIAISNTFGKIQLKWHTIIVKKDDSTTTNTSTSQTKRSGKDIGYTYEGAVDTKTPDGAAKAALATNNTQELILAPGSVTHVQEIDSQLNLHQTFDNYVEGESNKFCRSIGLTIAEHPQGTQFNPMFVHGPSGCGKTHLVNAIGLRCKEIYKNKRVLYVSAREFQMQYTNANMQGKINDFIGFYQTIDMLIVDDVQEWLNSAKTQETFFHIFNHLFRTDKRIILVSDRPPIQLSGMMDRLITRFSCGVLAEMEKPNVQLCVDILKRKIQRDGLHISEPVIKYIAENVNGSIREIQGIINSLMAYSITYNCNIDMNFVERMVTRAMKTDNQALTIDDIIRIVSTHYDVTEQQVKGRLRKREIVLPRQVIMYLADKHIRMPASRIGRCVGGRDHSTVIHSLRLITEKIQQDKDFCCEIQALEQELGIK
ncbi:MAG: chromosomal replication initiator protein DnaA [Prevotella sp.]|nr:chromosomal replication initiator protein DnaA [Prevotella sp.]